MRSRRIKVFDIFCFWPPRDVSLVRCLFYPFIRYAFHEDKSRKGRRRRRTRSKNIQMHFDDLTLQVFPWNCLPLKKRVETMNLDLPGRSIKWHHCSHSNWPGSGYAQDDWKQTTHLNSAIFPHIRKTYLRMKLNLARNWIFSADFLN